MLYLYSKYTKLKKITTTLLISLITFGTAYNQIAAPSWYKAMCGYDQGNSHVYADDELNIYFSAVFFDTLNFDYTGIDTTLVSTGGLMITKMDPEGNLQWMNTISVHDSSITPAGNLMAPRVQVNNGLVYVIAEAFDTLTLKPGDTSFLIPASLSMATSFIAAYNTEGSPMWVKNLRSTDAVIIHDFEVDNAGNLFIVGNMGGITDFDPSAAEYFMSTLGPTDDFIAKYDFAGNLIWVHAIKATGLPCPIFLETDPDGNVVISMAMINNVSADFDLSEADLIFDSNEAGAMVIAKYTTDADLVWAFKISVDTGYGGVNLTDMSIDDDGNIICVGRAGGDNPIDYDPSADVYAISGEDGTEGGMIAKYNGDGNFQWAYQWDVTGQLQCTAVATDNEGNAFVLGELIGTVDLDPSAAEFMITTEAYAATPYDYDGFIMQFDAVGNFVDAGQFYDGGNGWYSNDIFIDDADNLLITNYFSDSIDIDPTTDTEIIYSFVPFLPDDYEVEGYLAKYGNATTFVESLQNDSEIMLYPNPVQNTLHIDCPQKIESVAVFDITGKCIYINEQFNQSGIDMTSAPSGIYFIRIHSQNLINSGTFIKI